MERLVHDASGGGPEPGGLLEPVPTGTVERNTDRSRARENNLRAQRDPRVRDRVDGAATDAVESIGGSIAAPDGENVPSGDPERRDGDRGGMGREPAETEAQPRREAVDRRLTMHGADRAYVLNVDVNAKCRIESVTGLSYPLVVQAIRNGHVTVLRHWVHQALVEPTGQTLEQVGAIIDDIGGLDVFAAGMRSAGKRPKKARHG